MSARRKAKKPSLIIEEISAQREIAELQLERLKHIARERLLNYEEAKIYDLLSKNLLLAKGDATTITTTAIKTDQDLIPDDTLEQIANSIDLEVVNRSLVILEDENDKPKD